MSHVRSAILAGPVPIAELIAAKRSRPELADNLFANFLYYAKRNWRYIASSRTGGDALLDGTAHESPCGGIAKAFRSMLFEDLGVPEADVEYITIPGYVWTSPSYSSFDPTVTGNVREGSGRLYDQGCIFNEHYYLRMGTRFYDPCLATAYATRDESVKCRFGVPEIINRGEMMITPDRRTIVQFEPNAKVNGWQRGAWMCYPATKSNLKKYMGAAAYEKELALRGGNTPFGIMVKKLPA